MGPGRFSWERSLCHLFSWNVYAKDPPEPADDSTEQSSARLTTCLVKKSLKPEQVCCRFFRLCDYDLKGKMTRTLNCLIGSWWEMFRMGTVVYSLQVCDLDAGWVWNLVRGRSSSLSSSWSSPRSCWSTSGDRSCVRENCAPTCTDLFGGGGMAKQA